MQNEKIIAFVFIVMMSVAIVGCSSQKDGETAEDIIQKQEEIFEHDFSAKSALEKEKLTIEEMLAFAIHDEYRARQEYELIMDEYGEQKPFSNIIRAEVNHIEMLTEIYEKYEYELPEDNAIDYAILPDSL